MPLFFYITVASQGVPTASLKHPLDSICTQLRFELHSRRVPHPTGSPAVGDVSAWLTGSMGGSAPEHPPWQVRRKQHLLPAWPACSGLRQKRVHAKRAAVSELPQKSNSATSLPRQNNLYEIQLSSQSPLLGAVPLSQQQCPRTMASPSIHLDPCSPAPRTCARHICKAAWIRGHRS